MKIGSKIKSRNSATIGISTATKLGSSNKRRPTNGISSKCGEQWRRRRNASTNDKRKGCSAK